MFYLVIFRYEFCCSVGLFCDIVRLFRGLMVDMWKNFAFFRSVAGGGIGWHRQVLDVKLVGVAMFHSGFYDRKSSCCSPDFG